MKIKTLLQAPLILEELQRLNIDPITLNPNDRVKLVDGAVLFEPEKERFVSAKNEPDENSEQLEYQSLDLFHKLLEGDEYSSDGGETWKEIGYYGVGTIVEKWKKYIFRRKNTPEYYYLKEGDIIEEGDEFEGYKDHWHKANTSVGFKIPRDNYGYRRKIQKNPTS